MLKKLIPVFPKRFILTKTTSKLFSGQEHTKTTKSYEKTNTANPEVLNKIIGESLKKEIDNYYPVDENQLKSILNNKGFSFVNEENSKVIKLEKKIDDKLISVIITPKQPDFAQSEGENEGKFFPQFFH